MSTADRKARAFQQRSEDILAAALSLFKSHNWQSVTVEQIAERAEVAKGTLYKHFASKDEIYAHLAINFEHKTWQKIRELDPTLPVLERLTSLMRFCWNTQLSSEELHRVYFYCSRQDFRSTLSKETAAEMERISAGINLAVHDLMVEGINLGIFPRKPVPLLLIGVTSTMWGAVQLVWSGSLRDLDREQYLEELIRFMLAGLVYQDRQIVSGGAASRSAA